SRSDLSLPGLESDMLRLLGERSVQEELQLSPAQLGMVARLAGTRREALSGSPGPRREEGAGRARQGQNQGRAPLENPKPEQAARLRQIAWQKRGPVVLSYPPVRRHLQLTDEQAETIRGLVDRFGTARSSLPWSRGDRSDAAREAERDLGRLDNRIFA